MKAFRYERYGEPEVLEMKTIDKPSAKSGEVVLRVHAASVNAYDWRLVTAKPFLVRIMGGGLFRPKNKAVGADVAGVVESVGPGVTEFEVGDRVFGSVAPTGNGAFAEYVRADVRFLAAIPDGVTFEDAAAVPMAALTALQGLRGSGRELKGKHVAVAGASGGVGTYAVQLAKVLGAEVTAVCSTAKVDLSRSIGADHVVDYTRDDFLADSEKYDLILGVNGFRDIRDYVNALRKDGTYVMAGGNTRQILQSLIRGSRINKRSSRTVTRVDERPNATDLAYVADLLDKRSIRSVIDKTFAFERTPDAVAYVREGHAAGKVLVRVTNDGTGRLPAAAQ